LLRKQRTKNSGKDVREKETLYIVVVAQVANCRLTQLVGIQINAVTVENSTEFSQKIKNGTNI
jgi:hypothetical protein